MIAARGTPPHLLHDRRSSTSRALRRRTPRNGHAYEAELPMRLMIRSGATAYQPAALGDSRAASRARCQIIFCSSVGPEVHGCSSFVRGERSGDAVTGERDAFGDDPVYLPPSRPSRSRAFARAILRCGRDLASEQRQVEGIVAERRVEGGLILSRSVDLASPRQGRTTSASIVSPA
jgi:hypothetical protein